MSKDVKRLEDRIAALESALADARLNQEDQARQLALYRDATESGRDGIALYDADFRLRFCNQNYKSLFFQTAHLLTPGRPLEEIAYAFAAAGLVPDIAETAEDWARKRADPKRRIYNEPYFTHHSDGRWIRACDYPTKDGGFLAIRTDVTEMKQREAELQATTDEMRNILEAFVKNSPVPMLIKDTDRRYRMINDAFEKLYGVTAEKILGRRMEDAMPEMTAALARSADHAILQGSGPVSRQHRIVRPDGSEGTVTSTKFPIHGADGNITAIGAVSIDVTRFMEMQETLAAKSELLETTLRSIDQGFAVFDKDMRILAYNDQFFELHNYPTDKPIPPEGLNLRDMLQHFADTGAFGKKDPQGALERRFRLLTDPNRPQREERTQSDGRILDVRRKGLPDGGYVATFTDITDQKRAEQALRVSEENFRSLVENSEIGISITLRRRLLFANEAFARIFGYDDRDDVMRKGHYDAFIAPRDLKRVQAISDARSNNLPAPTVYEFEGIRKDGTTFWLQRTSRVVTWNGMRATLGTVIDVTQRHQAEDRLRRALDAAETANRAKSDFLAKMSHELRTPLNAIIGFSEVLGRETFGPLGHARYNSYVNDIAVSGRHLLEMINDILDMSKIESGGFELEAVKTDITPIITETVQVVRGQIEQRQIDFRLAINPATPPLYADQRAIRQILLNLLSNSIKFTPEGGRITITTGPRRGGGLFFAITDTGIGIAKENLEEVLKPFNQGSNPHSTVQPGTGLGLPIVKSLVEMHGGQLAIASEPGVGTTVTIDLPARPGEVRDQAQTG